MKRGLPLLTAAFGLATLCSLPILSPLVDTHTSLYHLNGSVSTLLLTVALFLVLLGLGLAGLFLLVEKFAKIRIAFWVVLLAVLPAIAFKVWCILDQQIIPPHTTEILFMAGVMAAIVVLTCWRPAFLPHFDRLQGLTQTIFSVSSILALLVLGHLFLLAWQVRAINAPQRLHSQSSSAPPAVTARVIWIVLDELSYEQVYEHRFPGLLLPTFDQLARESTLFTHTVPAGLMTEYVVPSLLSGIPFDAIRPSSSGRQLFLHTPQGAWKSFDPQQTVFRDALDHGYSTAIAGWYNPYCRLLAPVLDHCAWSNHTAVLKGGFSTDQSIFANLLAPVVDLSGNIFNHLPRASHRHRQNSQDSHVSLVTALHARDYRDLVTNADTLLNDSASTFVFLHLPIPHPSGIYDRYTHQFTPGPTTYLDNLVLADDYLSHLRAQLEQRGEWDTSTILITGDHSWRVAMWMDAPDWTPDEQIASNGGHFDDRPAYILKLPRQHEPARIETPFQAIHTRGLLDALMDRTIKNPQDLATWVSQQK